MCFPILQNITIIIRFGSKSIPISIHRSAKVSTLYEIVQGKTHLQVNSKSPFWLSPITDSSFKLTTGYEELPNSSSLTVQDCGLCDHSTVFILLRQCGGGKYKSYLYQTKICPNYSHCEFNNPEKPCSDIRSPNIMQKVAESKSNAWMFFCDIFDLQEYKDEIKENTSSDQIRFSDVMHILYHKIPDLTWETIRATVAMYDRDYARTINFYAQHYKII